MPRFMAYIWTDSDNPNECKFGDHWINEDLNFEEAKRKTIAYVRRSLGRSKHKFDDGRVKVHHVWDVSEYAKQVGRFFKHGKVDDVIRPCIGYHIQADFHRTSYQDAIVAVNKELGRFSGDLPAAGLSTLQHQALTDVLNAFANGKKCVLAELCARFGKTIWAGAVIRETHAPITVVASYVLTSFASFRKDLTSFKQFCNFEHVEASDPNWIEKIKKHRETGKQVVVYLSMCAGKNQHHANNKDNFSQLQRDQRIKTLYSSVFNEPILLVVDEADYGVHTQKQAEPLICAQRSVDRVILMTGTCAERAASGWSVDHYLSVTYPELLMIKAKALNMNNENSEQQKSTQLDLYTTAKHTQQNQQTKPKFFEIDHQRDKLAVDVWYYQIGLAALVDHALANEFGDVGPNGQLLPSWSKLAANPESSGAVAFFRNAIKAVIGGEDDNGRDHLTLRHAVRCAEKRKMDNRNRVAMMWLPGSITNANLSTLREIAQEALGGFVVIAISGNETYDLSQRKFTNRNSERYTIEIIKNAERENRGVLILAANMAQRSYSVPKITELYLAYDGGSEAATIQKISRAFTPNGDHNKVARVVSLSFDPARDDKFDALMIQSALNYQQKNNIVNTRDALAQVLRTINIIRSDENAVIRFDINTYLNSMLARNSLGRVIGKTADVYKLSAEEIKALAEGNHHVFCTPKPEAVAKGKTHAITKLKTSSALKNSKETVDNKLLAKAREVIVTFSENIDIFMGYAGASNLDEAMKKYAHNKDLQMHLLDDFGLDYSVVCKLFERGVINRHLVDLLYK